MTKTNFDFQFLCFAFKFTIRKDSSVKYELNLYIFQSLWKFISRIKINIGIDLGFQVAIIKKITSRQESRVFNLFTFTDFNL